MVAAIRAVGLAKSFGATVALRPLDLEVAEGEVVGYLGPNGAGKTTTIRCLLGLARASAGRAEIFGVDARPGRPRRTAGSPSSRARRTSGPALTGAETLHLLGRVQGQRRHRLPRRAGRAVRSSTPSKRVRAYSKGNRQKVLLIAALSAPGRPADPRRADDGPRPADGAGLPGVRRRGARPRPDGLPVVAHPQRGRGALRPGRDPARRRARRGRARWREMRHLSALSVDATFDGAPPDLSRIPGVTAVEVEGTHVRCQVTGSVEPLLERAGRVGGAPAAQPRAVAGGAVPGPLRQRAGEPVRSEGWTATVIAAADGASARGASGRAVGGAVRLAGRSPRRATTPRTSPPWRRASSSRGVFGSNAGLAAVLGPGPARSTPSPGSPSRGGCSA